MTTISSNNAVLIRTEAVEALKGVAQKLGLTVRLEKGRYADGWYRIEVEFAVEGASGGGRMADDFRRHAALLGLKPEDLGAEFRSGDRRFRITGMARANRTMPILAVDQATGRTYKFRTEDVIRALGRTA